MSMHRMRRGKAIPTAICFALGFLAVGCASVPRQPAANTRRTEYLTNHRDLSPDTVWALENGRVLVGMDTAQVSVALGDPDRQTHFANADADVWIYSAGRVRQDQLHTHGNAPTRLVFVNHRLLLIEPL